MDDIHMQNVAIAHTYAVLARDYAMCTGTGDAMAHVVRSLDNAIRELDGWIKRGMKNA